MDAMFLLRIIISALIIAAVSQIAGKMPKIGALILSLPIVTIIAIIFTYLKDENLNSIAILSREMFILVPIGLILFIPLAFSDQWNLNFWSALIVGIIGTSLALGLWMWIR